MVASQLFLIILLVLFSSIFSLVEASFLTISIIKVNALKREKKSGADALFYLKQNPKRLIVTTLLGNTVVNFTAVTIATLFALNYFGKDGALIATIFMSIFVLIFGQIIPKVIAEQNAVSISLFFSRPMVIIMKLLWPIVALFDKLAELVSKQFKSKDSISDDEFKMMILHSKQDGVLSRDSAVLMNKILDFQEIAVNKLMTPKKSVYVVDGSQKLSKVIDKILKTGYNHIPIYEKSKDHVVGVVSVATLIKALRDKKSAKQIKLFAKEQFVIPETKQVEDLIPDLINEQMAIIVNEYGYFVGVITLPDILGALFTKDVKSESIRKGIVSGKSTLTEINALFGVKLESDSINTIAGYIESDIQRIPKTGEKIQIKSLNIEIVRATKQEIKELKVTR